MLLCAYNRMYILYIFFLYISFYFNLPTHIFFSRWMDNKLKGSSCLMFIFVSALCRYMVSTRYALYKTQRWTQSLRNLIIRFVYFCLNKKKKYLLFWQNFLFKIWMKEYKIWLNFMTLFVLWNMICCSLMLSRIFHKLTVKIYWNFKCYMKWHDTHQYCKASWFNKQF